MESKLHRVSQRARGLGKQTQRGRGAEATLVYLSTTMAAAIAEPRRPENLPHPLEKWAIAAAPFAETAVVPCLPAFGRPRFERGITCAGVAIGGSGSDGRHAHPWRAGSCAGHGKQNPPVDDARRREGQEPCTKARCRSEG